MQSKNSIALASLVTVAGLLAASVRAEAPQVPALTVKTLAGADFDLAGLRGQVVLIHFWATWCPPCIKEMPALGSFYDKYHARGVEVIALSEDRTRDLAEVQHMVHHMDANYPVAMAHKASTNSLGDPSALPVTYVLDTHGVVRAEMRPDTVPVTEENLARIVEPLLPGR